MTPTEQRIHVFLSQRAEGATEEVLKRELGVSHGSLYNAMTHGVIYRDGVAWKAVISRGNETEEEEVEETPPDGLAVLHRQKGKRIPLVDGEYDSIERWQDDMQDVAGDMPLAFQYALNGLGVVTVLNEETGEEKAFSYKEIDGLVYVSQC